MATAALKFVIDAYGTTSDLITSTAWADVQAVDIAVTPPDGDVSVTRVEVAGTGIASTLQIVEAELQAAAADALKRTGRRLFAYWAPDGSTYLRSEVLGGVIEWDKQQWSLFNKQSTAQQRAAVVFTHRPYWEETALTSVSLQNGGAGAEGSTTTALSVYDLSDTSTTPDRDYRVFLAAVSTGMVQLAPVKITLTNKNANPVGKVYIYGTRGETLNGFNPQQTVSKTLTFSSASINTQASAFTGVDPTKYKNRKAIVVLRTTATNANANCQWRVVVKTSKSHTAYISDWAPMNTSAQLHESAGVSLQSQPYGGTLSETVTLNLQARRTTGADVTAAVDYGWVMPTDYYRRYVGQGEHLVLDSSLVDDGVDDYVYWQGGSSERSSVAFVPIGDQIQLYYNQATMLMILHEQSVGGAAATQYLTAQVSYLKRVNTA